MSQTQRGELAVFPDAAAVADEAARRFVALAQAAIAERGRFTVALSGGSTPRAMHERLAAPPLSTAIDWERVFVYWGDERMVPPDDADSSYRMARDTLLAHVPIPAANIVPAPTVGGTPADAARAYAETLIAQFGQEVPEFDLILLGIGPDGHTASLFPGQPEPSAPSADLVVAVHDSPKPPPDRISFTYRLINAAHNIMFVVTGADKAEALNGVLHGPPNRAHLPAQGVQPTAGSLVWLVDRAAAQALGAS
jgi:6-phosphogluconolactonase